MDRDWEQDVFSEHRGVIIDLDAVIAGEADDEEDYYDIYIEPVWCDNFPDTLAWWRSVRRHLLLDRETVNNSRKNCWNCWMAFIAGMFRT
jgi:hypothetical protein